MVMLFVGYEPRLVPLPDRVVALLLKVGDAILQSLQSVFAVLLVHQANVTLRVFEALEVRDLATEHAVLKFEDGSVVGVLFHDFPSPVPPIADKSGGIWPVEYALSTFGKTCCPTVCPSGMTT